MRTDRFRQTGLILRKSKVPQNGRCWGEGCAEDDSDKYL